MIIIEYPDGFSVSRNNLSIYLKKSEGWTIKTVNNFCDIFEHIYDDAFAEGEQKGIDDGYDSGFREGWSEGYDEGFYDGKNEEE